MSTRSLREKPFRLLWGLLFILVVGGWYCFAQKPVVIVADGNEFREKVLFPCSVRELLDKNQIVLAPEDRVSPGLDSVAAASSVITVERAFPVSVRADGRTQTVKTPPVPVREAIAAAGVTVNARDVISPALSAIITPEQEINVIRVSEATFEVEVEIPFPIEREVDDTLARGLTKTVREGRNGLALNTVKAVYHDNEEAKRTVIGSQVLKEPVSRVVAIGNIVSVSRGSVRMDFREAKYMQASAYTYTGHNTSSGRPPAVGLVAVDPSVIPLGSRLYIEGYGYAMAADTGGSIKGNKIDLFMEDYNQCIQWGRREVLVYILH
ncbi:MAG: ubiquitin-like domain-containing protein [Syntrophomonadaceae bacterium]|jgi:uncharacterized protein YabE (DUF348 family)|nr:ubiquitin-like domain-containing protein [Syntrophomonadaceae bacterium]